MQRQGPWVDRMLRVMDHIQTHLDEDISPEELARIAEFSRHHFHRVFRGMTGESVMGFVRRLRLERAAHRLKFSSEPVTDVALASGYGSHEAFTRAFRARFGASPSDYRSRHHVDLPGATAFEIRAEPTRHCIGVRYTGDYAGCGVAWGQVSKYAARTGLFGRATGSLGLVYDDPEITAADRLRYDACLVVPEKEVPPRLPDGWVHRTVSGGQYAVARHRGPHDTLSEVYVALLGRWLPHRGVELEDAPVVEIYLNTPDETPPEALETEVCVQIR